MLTTQMYLDGAFLALDLNNPLAWAGYLISRSNSEGLKTGFSGANMSGALLTKDWLKTLTQAGHWSLDHTLLQTPSAQSLTGPFVSIRPLELHMQDPYLRVDGQGYVQVTLQPTFSGNPTSWFAFPDSYVETTTTHWTMTERSGAAASWTGSTMPQITAPYIQQYTAPYIQELPAPYIQEYTAPYIQQYTAPYIPQFTMPPPPPPPPPPLDW